MPRLYIQKVSVRVSAAGVKFHPVVMSHIRSHSANVHLVRGITLHPPSLFLTRGSSRCRGLKVLVDLLDEDFAEQSELIVHALNGIGSVFELQSPTSTKNDFCRLFIREGLLDPLSSALLNVMASRGEAAADMKRKIIQILLVFCQVSQSDVHVRNALGTRKVVRRTSSPAPSEPGSHKADRTHQPPCRAVASVRTSRAGIPRSYAQGDQASVNERHAARSAAKCERD